LIVQRINQEEILIGTKNSKNNRKTYGSRTRGGTDMSRRHKWKNDKTLEPNITTDVNGKMLEEWTSNFNLHHLNLTEKCIGTYIFNSNKGKSAIDHILVNNKMFADYKGMQIDEVKMVLNISDHCLVRAWFKLGTNKKKSRTERSKNQGDPMDKKR